MAAKNSMPKWAIAQTEISVFESDNSNNIRADAQKYSRRLHGKRTDAASLHPRAETPQDSSACFELYSRMDKATFPFTGSCCRTHFLLMACW